MHHDEDRRRNILAELARNLPYRFDAAGRGADHDDVAHT